MNKTSGYMPQIDAMRFLAAFGVISLHWLARFQVPLDLSFGPYRVPMLLTLSGFLVTNILLKAKDRSENRMAAVRTFYIRRLLRILPAYYLFLLILAWLHEARFVAYWPYFVSLTSNYLQFAGVEAYSGNNMHLWNISVLEQFYLFFPWMILFVESKKETALAIFLIITGIAVRTYGTVANIDRIHMLPLTNFDFLGTGILLSILHYRIPKRLHRFLQPKALVLTIAFLAIAYFFFYHTKGWVSSVGYNTATIVFCFCLMYKTATGFKGLPGMVFNFKPFRFLGRLSYGMYIYHMATPLLTYKLLILMGMKVKRGYPLYFINLGLLIVICILSWYLIEKPIAGLKQNFRFRFKKRKPQPQVLAPEPQPDLVS